MIPALPAGWSPMSHRRRTVSKHWGRSELLAASTASFSHSSLLVTTTSAARPRSPKRQPSASGDRPHRRSRAMRRLRLGFRDRAGASPALVSRKSRNATSAPPRLRRRGGLPRPLLVTRARGREGPVGASTTEKTCCISAKERQFPLKPRRVKALTAGGYSGTTLIACGGGVPPFWPDAPVRRREALSPQPNLLHSTPVQSSAAPCGRFLPLSTCDRQALGATL